MLLLHPLVRLLRFAFMQLLYRWINPYGYPPYKKNPSGYPNNLLNFIIVATLPE